MPNLQIVNDNKMELGNKYTCRSCNTRFYDLKKLPAMCPACDTLAVIVSPFTKPKPKRYLSQRSA